MLEDKYQGNHQFINYGNQIQNSEVRNKLDQIHHIIHDKVKNHFLTSSIILMSSLMILIMSYIILNKF